MKLLFFSLLSGIFFTTVSKPIATNFNENKKANTEINFQDVQGSGRMACVAFKNQDFCRAELENFEFDVHFTVVSASVYFSGANFKNVEKGFITSNSLKPIKHLMALCMPSSNVVFDEVKVKGPDNTITTIQGISLSLY